MAADSEAFWKAVETATDPTAYRPARHTIDAYTHRIGRTGSAAKTGDAFTFVTSEDTDMIRAIERVLGEKLERRTLPDFDYNVPAPSRDTEFARPPRPPRSSPPGDKHRVNKHRAKAGNTAGRHPAKPIGSSRPTPIKSTT